MTFNEILISFEKKGGLLHLERQMKDFGDALEDYALEDLSYEGVRYTWE